MERPPASQLGDDPRDGPPSGLSLSSPLAGASPPSGEARKSVSSPIKGRGDNGTDNIITLNDISQIQSIDMYDLY